MTMPEVYEVQSDGTDLITSWGGYDFTPIEKVRTNTQGRLILVYGQGKVGKTTVLATALDASWVRQGMVIAVEPGLTVISRRAKLVYRDYEGMADLNALVKKMYDAPKGTLPFDVIGLDNLSALVNARIVELGGVAPDWDDYKRETGEISALLVRLRDVAWKHGIVVVVVAWDDYTIVGTGNTAIKYVHPFVNPALLKILPGIPDIIGFLEIYQKGMRKLTLRPQNNLLIAGVRCEPGDQDYLIPDEIYGDPISLAPILETVIKGVPYPVAYGSPSAVKQLAKQA